MVKQEKELMSNNQLIPFVKSQLKDRIWEKNLPEINERESLKQYKLYIEKRINSSIIINSNFDPKNRSLRAKPFKPALYIDT